MSGEGHSVDVHVPAYQTNSLGQGFQTSEHYKETHIGTHEHADTIERIFTPHSRAVIRHHHLKWTNAGSA